MHGGAGDRGARGKTAAAGKRLEHAWSYGIPVSLLVPINEKYAEYEYICILMAQSFTLWNLNSGSLGMETRESIGWCFQDWRDGDGCWERSDLKGSEWAWQRNCRDKFRVIFT